jgi:hypothetical protein
VDDFLQNTVSPFLDGYGLSKSMNSINQNWDLFNYLVVDVYFAYLSGDLTSDPDYA